MKNKLLILLLCSIQTTLFCIQKELTPQSLKELSYQTILNNKRLLDDIIENYDEKNIPLDLKEEILQRHLTSTASNLWAANDYHLEESPFDLLKKSQPKLSDFITKNKVIWKLSIQDLINAGARGKEKLKRQNGQFKNLSLTSLNGLQNIPNITALTNLYLQRNQITTITPHTFNDLSALGYLNLDSNKIKTIAPDTFDGLTALTSLDLERNQITTIASHAFYGLTALECLGLERNQITAIAPHAFYGLTALENLNLEGNQITTIAPGTFYGLAKLQELNLKYNQIPCTDHKMIKAQVPANCEIYFYSIQKRKKGE